MREGNAETRRRPACTGRDSVRRAADARTRGTREARRKCRLRDKGSRRIAQGVQSLHFLAFQLSL
jgi:hypothetical protein